jgi:hypothetical protein
MHANGFDQAMVANDQLMTGQLGSVRWDLLCSS